MRAYREETLRAQTAYWEDATADPTPARCSSQRRGFPSSRRNAAPNHNKVNDDKTKGQSTARTGSQWRHQGAAFTYAPTPSLKQATLATGPNLQHTLRQAQSHLPWAAFALSLALPVKPIAACTSLCCGWVNPRRCTAKRVKTLVSEQRRRPPAPSSKGKPQRVCTHQAQPS